MGFAKTNQLAITKYLLLSGLPQEHKLSIYSLKSDFQRMIGDYYRLQQMVILLGSLARIFIAQLQEEILQLSFGDIVQLLNLKINRNLEMWICISFKLNIFTQLLSWLQLLHLCYHQNNVDYGKCYLAATSTSALVQCGLWQIGNGSC